MMRNIDYEWMNENRCDLEDIAIFAFPEAIPAEIEEYILQAVHLMRQGTNKATIDFYTLTHRGILCGERVEMLARIPLGILYAKSLNYIKPDKAKIIFNENRDRSIRPISMICAAAVIGETGFLEDMKNNSKQVGKVNSEAAEYALRILAKQKERQPAYHD